MAEQIKDLGGVVNRDVAFSKVKEDVLYDSENFRITTEEGGTLAVRTNIRGNAEILSIPTTPDEMEIVLLEELIPGHSYTLSFTVTNYQTSITSVITYSFSYNGVSGFYNNLAFYLSSSTIAGNPSNALYDSEILLPSNFTKIIVRSRIGVPSAISLIDIGTSTNVTSSISITLPRTSQANLKIIGWCVIRETIYLLTTNGTFNPDTDPPPYASLGQWWRLDYDKSLAPADPLHYTIKLVYNNDMNITIQRPVANPGMIEGRYENIDVQKIYWTDNFNVPRQINVAPSADAITAALSVEQLSLLPALNMEPARITGFDIGGLFAGIYQVIYRLKNLNNTETRFSRPSASIPILEANEGVEALGYYPNNAVNSTNGTVTTKSIRVQIDNINTQYSTLELATIWYKDLTSLPEIRVVKTLAIPANGKIDTFITGNEDKVIITLDEATAFTTAIRRCKTLAAKKQTLFLGNLTIANQEVKYDARTYRFPINSNLTTIRNAAGDSYKIDANQNFKIVEENGVPVIPGNEYDVPEDFDCIQDYNSQSPDSDQHLLYLPNSNVLGGEGVNLKYVFITPTASKIKLDDKVSSPPSWFPYSYAPFYRPTYPDYPTLDTLANTPNDFLSPTYTNYQSPFNYGLYEGYMRDELYRFGVVFYDQLDNPTYVNWIADIRMPHVFMPNTTAGALYGTGTGTKPISSISYAYPSGREFNSRPSKFVNGELFANPLGLEFTFKTIPDPYFGSASIVRVERQQTDKHIVAQGLLRQSYTAAPCWWKAGKYRFLSPILTGMPEDNPKFFLPANGDHYQTESAEGNVWTFHSPEAIRFEDPTNAVIPQTQLPALATTDMVEIVGLYNRTDSGWLNWHNGTNDFGADGSYSDDFPAPGTVCFGSREIDMFTSFKKLYDFEEAPGFPQAIKGNTGTGGTNNGYIVKQKVDIGTRFNGPQFTVMTTNFAPGGSNNKEILGSAPTAFNIDPPGWRHNTPCDGQNANPTNGFIPFNSARHFMSATGRCTVFEFDFNQSYPDFGQGGSRNFLTFDGIWDSSRKYIGNYKRTPPLPYGGNTYFARSANNEYVYCGNFVDLTGGPTSTIVYGGDTVIEVFDKVLDHFNEPEHWKIKNPSTPWGTPPTIIPPTSGACQFPVQVGNVMRWAFFPVETSIPIGYRRSRDGYSPIPVYNGGNVPNRVRSLIGNPDLYPQMDPERIEGYEHFGLDPVYIHTSKSIYRFFPKNPSIVLTDTFDCRVWRSENKIDGENIESWSIYRPGLFKDVESAYGPLNNLVVFQDKLYFIQDRGFGTLQVDEQKLITDAQGESDLVLGSTGLLERYDYISTKTGTKHQFSMSVSDYSIIWFDTLARKIIRYKPGELQPISDIKGYHAFLYQETDGIIQTDDNPYVFQGVHSTYDYRFGEFYMTFVQPANLLRDGRTMPPNPFTLVYSELFEGFVGRYTHHPVVYINDKSNIFSVPETVADPLQPSTIFVHHYGDYGVFYNQAPQQSKLNFVINANPTIEKVLNNLEVSAEVFAPSLDKKLFDRPMMYDFFDRMRIYDNYQNSDFVTLVPNFARKHKTIWNIKVPSDKVLDVTQPIFDSANLSTVRPSITRRFKDKWFMVELVYDNTDNYKLVAHNAKALFTVNSR